MFLLDYNGRLCLEYGYFESKEEASIYLMQNDPDHYASYQAIEIPKARPDGDAVIPFGTYRYTGGRV